jgi:hypothetical protein
MVEVDFLSILLAVIAYMVVGSIWYSSYAFGKIRDKFSGIKKHKKQGFIFYIGSFFSALVMAYFIGFIESYLSVTSFWDGVIAGLILCIGFVIPSNFINFLWKDKSFKLFCLDSSYWLLIFIAMGGILAG